MYLGIKSINFVKNYKPIVSEYDLSMKVWNSEPITKSRELPDFEDLVETTETIIIYTNASWNVHKIFEYLPVTEFEKVQKKRGRKRKDELDDVNKNLPPMSVISMKLDDKIKGIDLKKNKEGNDNKIINFFRNSISIKIAVTPTKYVDLKIPIKGQPQITGCKNKHQCVAAIEFLYKYILQTEKMIGEKLLTINNKRKQKIFNKTDLSFVMFITMRNYNFNVGYEINKELLNTFINLETNYRSIYDGVMNNSVNVKFENNKAFETELSMFKIILHNSDKNIEVVTEESIISTMFFISILSDEEKKKMFKKIKYVSFLCFHTGNINLTGRGPYLKEAYSIFKDILITNRDRFECVKMHKLQYRSPIFEISNKKYSSKCTILNPLML